MGGFISRCRTPEIVLALGFLLLCGAPAFAQAHIVGTVKDSSDRPIKGATITAENPNAAPSTYTTTTDRKGRFAFLAMRAGEWTFTIRAPGFETARRMAAGTVGLNPALEIVLKAAEPEPRVVGALSGVDVPDLQRRLDAAAALANAGNLDEAIERYKEIGARAPALSSVHLQLGYLYERKGDAQAAAGEYQAVLEADPDNAKAKAGFERVSTPRN
jgi:tetratricopeptide (TPR) repeat protein